MQGFRFDRLERALFVGAHSDDIEIGCGGTVLRLLEEPELRRSLGRAGRRRVVELAARSPKTERRQVAWRLQILQIRALVRWAWGVP
mgnify:CR=1 FL=1